MLFGICLGLDNEENMRIVTDYGYDYVETGFQMFVRGSDQQRRQAQEWLRHYGVTCLAANCFLPGDLKTCGEGRDLKSLYDYVKTGLDFGASIGLKTVVFGSGGARQVPAGYDFVRAFSETAEFLSQVAAPLFREYGMQLVIEPLRSAECNMINTVKEGAMLASAAGSDSVACLADIYHMHEGADRFSNITDLGGMVRHAHISYPLSRDGMNRSYPRRADEYPYKDFIGALKAVGCQTCSIEAGIKDLQTDAAVGMKILRMVDAMED